MKLNKLITATISLALLIVLTNCNKSPDVANTSANKVADAPPAAIEAAINFVKINAPGDNKFECPTGIQELKDISSPVAIRNGITPADAANGLEDSWVIGVRYIYKCNGEDKWRDGSKFTVFEKMKGGVWEPKQLKNQ